jgi:hypothetical protein
LPRLIIKYVCFLNKMKWTMRLWHTKNFAVTILLFHFLKLCVDVKTLHKEVFLTWGKEVCHLICCKGFLYFLKVFGNLLIYNYIKFIDPFQIVRILEIRIWKTVLLLIASIYRTIIIYINKIIICKKIHIYIVILNLITNTLFKSTFVKINIYL